MKYNTILSTIKVVAALAVAAFTPFTGAARTAADFFVSAPASVVPLLDRNTRLDMIDYFRHGLPTPSTNAMEGESRINAEKPGGLDVQLSRDASLTIGLVPLKADTLIAVIETVLTPVADSSVAFYSTSWQPVKAQPALPVVADFLAEGTKSLPKGIEMPGALYMTVSYNPETGVFTFANTTAGYYAETERPEALNLLRPSIEMRYDGRRFVPLKR